MSHGSSLWTEEFTALTDRNLWTDICESAPYVLPTVLSGVLLTARDYLSGGELSALTRRMLGGAIGLTTVTLGVSAYQSIRRDRLKTLQLDQAGFEIQRLRARLKAESADRQGSVGEEAREESTVMEAPLQVEREESQGPTGGGEAMEESTEASSAAEPLSGVPPKFGAQMKRVVEGI